MNLIFLDLDEVLMDRVAKRFYSYRDFNPTAVKILQWLVTETNAKIVITSTWRILNTLEDIYETFKRAGWILPLDYFIGVTPQSDTGFRGHEVQEYLRGLGGGHRAVFIDDSTDYTEEQRGNLIWIRDQIGLTFAHAEYIKRYFEKGVFKRDLSLPMDMHPPASYMREELPTNKFWYRRDKMKSSKGSKVSGLLQNFPS